MEKIKPKKKWGQHFLTDANIAKKIVSTLSFDTYNKILEIGPGKGFLTEFLFKKKESLYLIEIDNDSCNLLKKKFPRLKSKIFNEDFLKIDLKIIFQKFNFAVVGNFPYNISSQIVFKIIDHKESIPFFCGMFQKEVAKRICENAGTKSYGILSVICSIFYRRKYLFNVSPKVFVPVPNVESGVISLTRKENFITDCNEKLLFKIIKLGFQQRRKKLRNSLKIFDLPKVLLEDSIFDLRPEFLSGNEFIKLTKKIENAKIQT